MSRKNSPSSNSNSTNSDDSCNSWMESNSYHLERFFPHMFKLLLQQMRLQRAIITYLTAESGSIGDKSLNFSTVLKESIVQEKKSVLRLLEHHQQHLQDIKAPDVIVGYKRAQVDVVKESIDKFNGEGAGGILSSTLEELDHDILTEYLDLVTDFVGEDSNWPIGNDAEKSDGCVNEMLRS
jgi:hypothetical protein